MLLAWGRGDGTKRKIVSNSPYAGEYARIRSNIVVQHQGSIHGLIFTHKNGQSSLRHTAFRDAADIVPLPRLIPPVDQAQIGADISGSADARRTVDHSHKGERGQLPTPGIVISRSQAAVSKISIQRPTALSQPRGPPLPRFNGLCHRDALRLWFGFFQLGEVLKQGVKRCATC